MCLLSFMGGLMAERTVVKSIRKGMPTRAAIKRYWLNTSIWRFKCYGRKDLEMYNICFACGMESAYNLDRAHIIPLMYGGTNDCSNIHLLCSTCHAESEYLDDDNQLEYYNWFFGLNYNSNTRIYNYNPIGNPQNLTIEARKKGADINKKISIEKNKDIAVKMIELRNQGNSYNAIAKILSDNYKAWHAMQVKRIIDRVEV